jgi:trehalose 6-phosphate phosphatase
MFDADPANDAVFLDLDGTLIDIAPTPDGARIPPDLIPILTRVSVRLRGALAIISGRSISVINRFLSPLAVVAAGVHGAELCAELGGEVLLTVGPLEPQVVAAVSRLSRIAAGVVVEPKLYSIAVHYRLVPTAEQQIEAELRRILEDSPDHLILCPGRKVFEVVPKQISKGAALEALLRCPAFRGRRPIMIGDDVPDQSAFDVATRYGGAGLRVAGEHFSHEVADFTGPSDVRSWLAAIVEEQPKTRDRRLVTKQLT